MTRPVALSDTIFVPVVEEVPRLSDAERAELLASIAEAEALFEAGDYEVLSPDTLRREFELVLSGLDDDEIDARLGLNASR